MASSAAEAGTRRHFKIKTQHIDELCDYPTRVTVCSDDFWFSGGLFSLRKSYRYLANYKSGFAIFQIQKVPNPNFPSGVDHIALLDLDGFLSYFGQPRQLAARLTKEASALMERWRAINETAQPDFRRPTDFSETISKYTWINAKNREEVSLYQLTLSTFGHTKQVDQWDEKPSIRLGDLKVLIKLKTTSGAGQGPDKSGSDEAGFRNDRHGYNANFCHFLGLLRSQKFADLVEEVKAARRVYLGLPPVLPEREEEEGVSPPKKAKENGD